MQPERNRARLAKPEQRMHEGRVGEAGPFHGVLEPAAFSLPGIERQAARIGGPVEASRASHVVSRYMALCRERRKRVLLRLFAAQCRQDAALALSRTKRIVQIGLQYRIG